MGHSPFLSDPASIRVQHIAGAIRIENSFGAIESHSLNCAVCECAFFFAWCKDAFDGAVRESRY